MVIRTLTPKDIWSYQTYSTTTCSPLWIPFIAEHILFWFFFNLASSAKKAYCDLSREQFFVDLRPTQHSLLSVPGHLAFTNPPVYCAIIEKLFFSFWTSCFSRDRTNVWFPNSHTLGDLGEKSPCQDNCMVSHLKTEHGTLSDTPAEIFACWLGEMNLTASDYDFQVSCPKGTWMLAFLTSWRTSGDGRRQRHQLIVAFENKTTVTCKREQNPVAHWWYSPWLNQCFCIMHDLQWIVDTERNAAHLLMSRLPWKYCISNIHLTPHVSL